MHIWVMVALRIPLWSILKIDYRVCIPIIFIAGVILPILISHFVIRKSKLLKFLLLGIKS